MYKKIILSAVLLSITLFLQASTYSFQKRDVGKFTSIRSSSSVDIIVEQTGKYELEVRAAEKYFEYIKTEVNNGELNIYIKGSLNYSGQIAIYIQVKDLNAVVISGSGDFSTKGVLVAPAFSFRVSGSGDFFADLNSKNVIGSLSGSGDAKLSGITESVDIQQSASGDLSLRGLHLISAKLKMSGSGDSIFSGSSDYFELSQFASGDFSGKDFSVENAKIRKSSSGDASIHVEKTLDLSISGSGDLFYSGKPDITNLRVTGSGNIIRIK